MIDLPDKAAMWLAKYVLPNATPNGYGLHKAANAIADGGLRTMVEKVQQARRRFTDTANAGWYCIDPQQAAKELDEALAALAGESGG